MAACAPSLLTDAECLTCLSTQQLLAIIACQLATQNGMSCDPTLLSDAECLTCLTPQQLLAIIACQLASGGGGGGGSTQVYFTASPPAAPADPTKAALWYPQGGGAIKEWNGAAWV